MQLMEGYWLKSRPFAAGNAISLADLLWICELEQLQTLQGAEQVCRPPLLNRQKKWPIATFDFSYQL